jgi:hypothetical protein
LELQKEFSTKRFYKSHESWQHDMCTYTLLSEKRRSDFLVGFYTELYVCHTRNRFSFSMMLSSNICWVDLVRLPGDPVNIHEERDRVYFMTYT